MQLTMFGGTKPLKITKPIRLIELFGGIGCQAQALTNLGAEFEHYRLCEFDKYAVASYNDIHGTSFKKSDIRDLSGGDLGICNTDKFEYIMTYSFPCQDLSTAGKQLGLTKGSGTRSGLLWEVERLLDDCQELPQILLMENVTQVHGAKNMEDFRMWLEFLESKGYKNYYQDLNATSYGVAQNRDRCFMVSCLGDYYYDFPLGFKLKKRLKDYLEAEVDERYYLSQKQIENFKTSAYVQNTRRLQEKDVCDTLCARDYKDPKCVVVGDLHIPGRLESACRVHSVDGVAPACNTCGGGGRETKILEPTILQQGHGFAESRELGLCPTVTGEAWNYNNFLKEPIAYDEQNKRLRMDGTVGTLTTDGSTPKHNNRVILPNDFNIKEPTIIEDFYANRKPREYADTCPTLRSDRSGLKVKEPITYDGLYTNCSINFQRPPLKNIARCIKSEQHDSGVMISNETDYRIRKLTPRECWRLMGWQDEQFEKAQAVNSNSQLYKQAGNGIVIQVLEQIFKELL
ncbi:MAG: DNA (cytosine-5-)-methyltransferase [Clostridia bacterium]